MHLSHSFLKTRPNKGKYNFFLSRKASRSYGVFYRSARHAGWNESVLIDSVCYFSKHYFTGLQSNINLNSICRDKFSLEGVLKSGSADKSNFFGNLMAKKYSSFRSKRLYFR